MQWFCDGLYVYDTVWSAKRIYFTPAEQLSVIMMLTKRQLVVKLMEKDVGRYFYQRRPSKVVKRGVADKAKEDEDRKPKRSRPTTKIKGGNLILNTVFTRLRC